MQLGPLNTEPPTPGFEWSNVLVAITGTEFRPRRNADLGAFLQHNQRRPVLNVLTQPLRQMLLHLYEAWAIEDTVAGDERSPEDRWKESQADMKKK